MYLKTKQLVTSIAINKFQWNKLAFGLKSPTSFLKASILAIIGSIPGGAVKLIGRRDVSGKTPYVPFDPATAEHAEIIVARWALNEYGAYPTPYRVLAIASSIGACTDRGVASCAFVLPQLKARQPLLFEKTVFPSIF
jgi:hypothetical protein